MVLSQHFEIIALNEKKRMVYSIKFRLRNQNHNLKTGLTPLYVRMSVNSVFCTDFYSGLRIKPETWLENSQEIRGKTKEVFEDNQFLQNIKDSLKELINYLQDFETVHHVKKRFLTKEIPVPFLVTAFEQYIIEEKETENLHPKTIEKWYYSKNHLLDFVGEKFHILDINKTFGNDYYKFLIKKAMSNNHAIRNLSYLNTVLNFCVEKDFILKNPLIRKNTKKDTAKPIYYLNAQQIEKIENLDVQGIFKEVLDLFLFTCYTSLDNNEMLRLKPIHIKTDVIEIYRGKGMAKNSLQIVPILPKARNMLEKYNYQLPKHETYTINRYLHVIESLINLPYNLTTKVGRKTSGTFFLLNSVPLEVVSRILGHKSIKTTQTHYADILTKLLILEKTKHLM